MGHGTVPNSFGKAPVANQLVTHVASPVGLLVEATPPEYHINVTHVTFYWRNLKSTLTLSTYTIKK